MQTRTYMPARNGVMHRGWRRYSVGTVACYSSKGYGDAIRGTALQRKDIYNSDRRGFLVAYRWKRKESKGERLAWAIPTLDRNVRIHAEGCAGVSARRARRAWTYKRGSVKRSTPSWSGRISRNLLDKHGQCSAVMPDIVGTYCVLI